MPSGSTRIWHGVVALLAAFAIGGQLVLSATHDGRSLINLFSYFTIQSNILVLVAAALIAINPDRNGRLWTTVRLAGLTGITATGLIFATVLAGSTSFSGIEWWYDKILHYIVPAMVVFGFFAFRQAARFSRRDLAFIVWPIAWLAYTLIRAEVSNPTYRGLEGTHSGVPYDFLDAGKYGYGQVTLNCLGVTVLMVGLSALYIRASGKRS